MASSHSLLDIRTTVITRTAAVALMNASEAAVCRCQGWKANLNQLVSRAFVTHLVLWSLGSGYPLGGSLGHSVQSDEQSARPKFQNSSERFCNSVFYSFDTSCFICLLKNFPEEGCFSDSVTTRTKLQIQGANALYFGVLGVS